MNLTILPEPKPIKAGTHRAFITLPSASMEGYETPSGILVMPDWNKRQEEKAAVIGTVVAASCEGLKEGDKVAVNYEVTSDGSQEDGFFKHDNAYVINGQMVWMAVQNPGTEELLFTDRVEQIIAVERDGHWKALGQYVLLKKIITPSEIKTTLILPDFMQNVEAKNRGIHVSGLDAPIGATILFEQAERSDTYRFDNGEEFIVVMHKQFCWGILNEVS